MVNSWGRFSVNEIAISFYERMMAPKLSSFSDFLRRHPVISAVSMVVLAAYMLVCIRKGNDFLTYYELGKMALGQAGQIYISTASTGMTVPYLPHFFILMLPWALLPFPVSAGLWFWMKIGLLSQLIAKFRLWSSRFTGKERVLHVVLPLVICANYLNGDFRLGQVNLIIHALLVFSFMALLAGRHVISALLFVLSSFKVTPLALLPYFIMRRQWRFLLAVAGWAAVFAVLFVAWFGWQESTQMPQRWLNLIQSHKLGLLQVAEIRNQSIFGVVARSATVAVVNGREMTLQLRPEALTPETYNLITYGICLALLGGVCLWTLFRKTGSLNVTEFSAFLTVMLLISPDTRSAHMVHLLLPSYLLVSSVKWARFSPREHWWYVVFCLAMIATSRDIVGFAVHNWALYVSSQFLTTALLLVLLIIHSGKIDGNHPQLRWPASQGD